MNHAAWLLVLLALFGCAGGGGDDGAGGGGLVVPEDALPEQEPNDTSEEALELGALDTGRVLTGTVSRAAAEGGLAAGDLDLVRFQAPACGRLVARLDHEGGADYDLALFDESGRRLATSRSALAPERLFACVEAGATYLLEVGGHSGAAGAYVLRLEIDGTCARDPVSPAASSSAAVGSMGRARSFHAVAPLPGGGALVAGGTSDPSSPTSAMLGALRTTEVYDPTRDAFSSGPDLQGPRFGPTATALPSGRVLVAGGDLAGTADLYDPWAGGALAEKGLPLAAGMRALHTATLLPDGRVLLAGGTRVAFTPAPVAEHLATTEVFDPKTRAFTAGPTLAHVRTSHAAALLPDGRVLVTGGVGRADSEIATPDAVVPGPALAGVRDDHRATRLADGRILLTGGQDGSGHSLDTAEILDDVSAPAFRLLASKMGGRRADHETVRLPSGQVLVLGGEDDPGDGSGDVLLASVDVFDPATEVFTAMPALATPRDDHRAVRLLDGRVLVTGGENETSTASIADSEAYRPR